MMEIPDGYKIFEFAEESSFYDPKSTWNNGGEYYETTFRCLIPVDMEDDEEIDAYIEEHQYDEEGFWLQEFGTKFPEDE